MNWNQPSFKTLSEGMRTEFVALYESSRTAGFNYLFILYDLVLSPDGTTDSACKAQLKTAGGGRFSHNIPQFASIYLNAQLEQLRESSLANVRPLR
jgi:hypothetical protein